MHVHVLNIAHLLTLTVADPVHHSSSVDVPDHVTDPVDHVISNVAKLRSVLTCNLIRSMIASNSCSLLGITSPQ